jgi:aryl-alcohol dehydrogenase-like predicted oxidoreductase
MDYVDSFLIHSPPFSYLDGYQNDHYEILEQLKEEGKILAYGASIDTANEMNKLLTTTGSKVIEAFFNILHQDVRQSFELAQQKGAKIIAKIPLDSGWLGGNYDENSKFTDIRSRWSTEDVRVRAHLIDELREIVGEQYMLPDLAMAFCLSYDAISTVIPGNTRVDQLERNIKSVDLSLSDQIRLDLEAFYENKVKALQIPW